MDPRIAPLAEDQAMLRPAPSEALDQRLREMTPQEADKPVESQFPVETKTTLGMCSPSRCSTTATTWASFPYSGRPAVCRR